MLIQTKIKKELHTNNANFLSAQDFSLMSDNFPYRANILTRQTSNSCYSSGWPAIVFGLSSPFVLAG